MYGEQEDKQMNIDAKYAEMYAKDFVKKHPDLARAVYNEYSKLMIPFDCDDEFECDYVERKPAGKSPFCVESLLFMNQMNQ